MKKMWMAFSVGVALQVGTTCVALTPVGPERVLTADQIATIEREKNYFLYKNMDDHTPIWRDTNRQYGSHYLADHDQIFNLDQVLHHAISVGFPIQQRLQTLYRAKLAIHAQAGEIIPHIDIAFGQGAIIDMGRIFAGLFGFVLPQNWLRLANYGKAYKIAKLLLLSTTMDEILKTKTMYVNQHQRIQDFEILNYYFVHLQLFARMFPQGSRELDTLIGTFAGVGTDMASQRGDTKLGFDDIALQMALEKVGDDFTANRLNIADLKPFPEKVLDLADVEEMYKDKEKFLEMVVQRSLELKAIRELYEISKLDVGITATGSMFTNIDRPFNITNDARFAFRFGYGTLPNIMISRSFASSSEINVRSQYMQMLDNARRSFDLYTNALGGYTEAKRSLAVNRQAFKENLEHLIRTKQAPDAMFIVSFNQLLYAELKLNNALHGSLRARGNMDRILLNDKERALHHLPQKTEIMEFFHKMINENKAVVQKEAALDELMVTISKKAELQTLLFDREHHPLAKDYTLAEMQEAVKRNMMSLLYSSWGDSKSKGFFRVIDDFVQTNKIELTHREQHILGKKIHSFWHNLIRKPDDYGSYTQHFKFEDFGKPKS